MNSRLPKSERARRRRVLKVRIKTLKAEVQAIDDVFTHLGPSPPLFERQQWIRRRLRMLRKAVEANV